MFSYCPSLRVQAYKKGKKQIDYQWGDKYKYYDLASLTKPIFTLSAFMKIYEQDPHILDLDVGQILGWPNFLGVRVQDLLCHRSGLVWWRPYYNRKWQGRWQKRREVMARVLMRESTHPQSRAVYSDVDYMVLGFVLENLLNKDLLECWQHLNNYFPKNQLHIPVPKPQNILPYAPTFSHQRQKKWIKADC